MSHPITALQTALVTALRDDTELAALVDGGVFDAPPKGRSPPYVTVARHDLLPRDGDLTPGNEHRILLQVLSDAPSRKSVLGIVERVLAVVLDGAIEPDGLAVTLRRHERTETSIDAKTGLARAAVTLRMFSEAG